MAVSCRHPQSHAGFTIVDLLVCLAVILMLIAILMPSLKQARLVGYRAVCMANEYEQGKFIERYAQENQGYFPKFQYAVSIKSDSLAMTTLTRTLDQSGLGYFQNKVMTCPVDTDKGSISYIDGKYTRSMIMSYAFNVDLLLQERRNHMFQNPSEVVTMYDGSMSGKSDGGYNIEGSYAGSYDFIEHARVNRHMNMNNVLYLDGHVEKKFRFLPRDLATDGTTIVAANWNGWTSIYDDGNNGHGNNGDGVDSTNEGAGDGGPTGADDPSGTIDDENTKDNNGKGNTK